MVAEARALECVRGMGAGRIAAWRAHAYGGRGELRLEAARVPPLRAPDNVLIRVRASSINPLDIAMLDGYGARILNALRRLEGDEGVEFPLVCGRDFVGEVASSGPTARLRPGARVWGVVPPHRPGAHQEYVIVKDAWAGPAPETMDDAQAGGALYAALSACAVLRAAGLRGWGGGMGDARGARVLLLGLGGVGHAALQLLVAAGAQVVVGCAGEQCSRAAEAGAITALDRHSEDYDHRLIDCGPYEAILDCAGLGGGEAGARGWQFRKYATLTTPLLRETDSKGLALGVATAATTLLSHCVSTARAPASTAATTAFNCPPHVRWAYFMPNANDIDELRRLAEQGRFNVQVERVFPWWEGAAAYERASQGHARGKLIIDFTATPPPQQHPPGVPPHSTP